MKKIALMVLALVVMAGMSFAKDKAPKAQKINGFVTDAKCSAKAGEAHADCAKKCIEKGEKAVFVTDGDKKILNIENADAVKGHEGHHVSVKGHVNGDKIHIDKVSMLKAPKAAKQKDEHKHGM
jgi:uncharacterized protein YxeA